MNTLKVVVCTQSGQWINVSERQAILYGAGYGCFEFMNEMQLPRVGYVADSDEDKWGKEIELLNTIYQIQSPGSISNLKLEKYYIIITSKVYAREIKQSIEMNVGKDRVLICDCQNVFFSYKQIEDMFWYDPLIKKGLLLSNLSFAVENIISLFKNIVKTFNHMVIDHFIPSRGGESKLVFFFGNQAEMWVFSVPGIHNDWEEMGLDRDRKRNKEIRFVFRKHVDIDKKITVYEDKNGVLIQKYAGEYVDFTSKKIKKSVLTKCHDIHQINEVIEIENDMISRYFINLTEKVLKTANWLGEEIKEVERTMKKALIILNNLEYIPKICHCDLSCSNVVNYKGELFFIDWEYMAMCDPMFDVCGFLFSVGLKFYESNKISYENALKQMYLQLRGDLYIYFQRGCTQQEYLRAILVLLIFEYRELLGEILSTRTINNKKKALLLDHINFIIYEMEVCKWI